VLHIASDHVQGKKTTLLVGGSQPTALVIADLEFCNKVPGGTTLWVVKEDLRTCAVKDFICAFFPPFRRDGEKIG